jgi:hypothetical protein
MLEEEENERIQSYELALIIRNREVRILILYFLDISLY